MLASLWSQRWNLLYQYVHFVRYVRYDCLCDFLLSSWILFQDAAELYESGCHFEAAGALYVICKNHNKVMNILQHITSPKLQIMVSDLWASDAKNFLIK